MSWGVSMRTIKWLGLFCAMGLAGCSVYPIPDDVLSYNTEDIIRQARCEMRSAIIDRVIDRIIADGQTPPATEGKLIEFLGKLSKKVKDKLKQIEAEKKLPEKQRKTKLTDLEKDLYRLLDVAVVYTFDFNITEKNNADGEAAFKLPFTTPKVLDVGASASLNMTRQGIRQFSAADKWGDMIKDWERCKDVWPRHQNIVYPLDGSIGVGPVVTTFIDLVTQGGAKDSFVDTLIFTTQVAGGANASVKLDAVPHSFRLVSARAGLSGSRLDVHKMVISIAFPRPIVPRAVSITGELSDGYLNAPFDRPADWQARYNICLQDARAREREFNQLREEPPEVYCITYADNFAPQYGKRRTVLRRGPGVSVEVLPADTGVRPNRY